MSRQKHINHYHRHFRVSYPVSLGQRLYSILIGPLFVVLLLIVIVAFFSTGLEPRVSLSIGELSGALLFTVLRIISAYTFAVIVALPLALLVCYNALTEKIFLPLFDILESIPVLAFFPILILVFVRFNFLNGAAIFILSIAMLWNLVFTLVGGIKMIPRDIISAAAIFKIRGAAYIKNIVVPAVFPHFVTGSILAVAQAWNLIIVAEVIHPYVPHTSGTEDLFGIGSLLVRAVAEGHNAIFLASLLVMVLAIAFLNFFIWQKLLHYANRYKFE